MCTAIRGADYLITCYAYSQGSALSHQQQSDVVSDLVDLVAPPGVSCGFGAWCHFHRC